MTETGCPFCNPDASRVLHAGKLVLGLWDGFPVSPGQALLITKRHVTSFFDTTPQLASINLHEPAISRIRSHVRIESHGHGRSSTGSRPTNERAGGLVTVELAERAAAPRPACGEWHSVM